MPPVDIYNADLGRLWFQEGEGEKFRQGNCQTAGDFIQMCLNPLSVGQIVVVAQFCQYAGGAYFRDFTKGCCGDNFYQLRVGIDLLQLSLNEFCGPLTLY